MRQKKRERKKPGRVLVTQSDRKQTRVKKTLVEEAHFDLPRGCPWRRRLKGMWRRVRRVVNRFHKETGIVVHVKPEPDPAARACMGAAAEYDPSRNLATIRYRDFMSPEVTWHELGHVRFHQVSKYPRPVWHTDEEYYVAAWVSSTVLDVDLAARQPDREKERLIRNDIRCFLTCGAKDEATGSQLTPVLSSLRARYFSLFSGVPGVDKVIQTLEREVPGTLDKAGSLPLEKRKYEPDEYKEKVKEVAKTLGYPGIHFPGEKCGAYGSTITYKA